MSNNTVSVRGMADAIPEEVEAPRFVAEVVPRCYTSVTVREEVNESLLTLCERLVETSRKIEELLNQMREDIDAQQKRADANRAILLAEADKLTATIRSIA